MTVRRGNEVGPFQEGVVHGHIHNFNNMTYIHGHIHHNVQYHGEDGLDEDTKPGDLELNVGGEGHSHSSNQHHKSINKAGDDLTNMNSLGDQAMQYIDCMHFEFMDPNGMIPSNFNMGFNNAPPSQQGMSSGNSDNIHHNHEFHHSDTQLSGLNSSTSSVRRGSRISLSDDLLNTPVTKRRRTSPESNATDNDCSCNPKLLEVCCEVEHHPGKNANIPLDGISLNRNQEYLQSSLNESKVLNQFLSFSPSESTANLHYSDDSGKKESSNSLQDRRRSSLVNINDMSLSQYKQILDLNCDLTCEPMCANQTEKNAESLPSINNNSVKQETTKSPLTSGHGIAANEIKNSMADSGNMLDHFCQACERVGEYNECHNPTHHHVRDMSRQMSQGDNPTKTPSYANTNSGQYHTHKSSKQLDMKIISDICAISDLYETPIGGHMNHHHHMHSKEDAADTGPKLMRTQSYNILNNVMNRQPTDSRHNSDPTETSSEPKIQPVNQEPPHVHHHHKIQVHNHSAPDRTAQKSDKYVSCERFKPDYKSPFTKVEQPDSVSDIITMYHQNDHTPVKNEQSEQLNTINFNWNFKRDTENPDSLKCKWGDCNHPSTSLIDLQKHLFKDHLGECNIPSNPVNIKSDTPEVECKWQDCDFHSNDICCFVNHINNAHGINFDMKFIDPNAKSKDSGPSFMGQDHHTFHCKKEICPVDSTSHEVDLKSQSNYEIDHHDEKFTTLPEPELSTKDTYPANRSPPDIKNEPLYCEWEDCGEVFSTAEELDNHLINFHLPKGQSSYVCHWKDCGRKLGTRQKIMRHLKKHSGYKPFVCDVCAKRFATKESLNQHGRTHSGERPYKCPYCDKTFATSTFVNIHVRTHTGEKPWECSVCGKTFSESSNLNKHKKTHMKEFKCSNCLRSFSTHEKLEKHSESCNSNQQDITANS